MSHFIGQQVGNYQVTASVASGTYGSVYLGRHTIFTNRVVAIKILHAHLNSQQEQKRFIDEALLLEKLKYPHILPIIDANISSAGFPYLVMDYAANGSLRDRLKQQSNQPLVTQESLTILSQLGEALQHAHQLNIIHRDLKPENILFNEKGEVWLADFGIAIVAETISTLSPGLGR